MDSNLPHLRFIHLFRGLTGYKSFFNSSYAYFRVKENSVRIVVCNDGKSKTQIRHALSFCIIFLGIHVVDPFMVRLHVRKYFCGRARVML